MTATGQDKQEPASEVAAPTGERRPQAYLVHPPRQDGEEGVSGGREWAVRFQHAPSSSAADPSAAPAGGFVASQQAGLAAAIGLAKDGSGPDAPAEFRPPRPPPIPAPSSQSFPAVPGLIRPRSVRPTPVAVMSPPKASAAAGPAASETPGSVPAGTRGDDKRGMARRDAYAFGEFPLVMAILTAQAVLSLRFIWSNTAFHDEAVYLSAGHVEIEGWLHGTSIPPYAAFFSGAPVIYPPIGAIANSVGGLVAARILSLLFMLGATSFLWSMTSKLFGKKAGVCAAALFAVLGPTLQVGGLATIDAMALFLLAASSWCVVAARDRDDSALLLVAGTVLLALSNATAYPTMLLDLSVFSLAGLSVAAKGGVKAAVARSGYVAAGAIGLISALLAIGGPLYLAGALNAIAPRAGGDQSSLLVLKNAWGSVWIIGLIAIAGLALCVLWRRSRVHLAILAILAISGVLIAFNQARIHSATSLSLYIDFGAWFVAAAAGYAIAQLSQIGRWRSLCCVVAVLILLSAVLPAGIRGFSQADEFFKEWPNSTRMTAELLSLTDAHPGNYLAEGDSIPAYYLESSVSWERWSDTAYFRYTPPGAHHSLNGPAAYQAAINRHYFALIILDFGETVQTDGEIISDMDQAGGYEVIRVVPSSVGQYTIWAYVGPQPSGDRRGRH